MGARWSRRISIFSAVEDAQGRLWVGTLGGGLRRIEVRDGVPQDTLHLTRQEGLGSNLILALAVGPDGAVWAATDEGVSRLRARGETVEITNFAGLGKRARAGAGGGGRCGRHRLAGHGCRPVPAAARGRQRGGGTSRVASGPRLILVAGNNQSALPGQELPTPLVVRLEDQVGAPVVGAPLSATLLQGDAVFLSAASPVTDAQGEARFRLQAGQSEADLVVEVAAPALPQVAPVQFLAIIGEVDTPGVPLDMAVAGDLVFVAANAMEASRSLTCATRRTRCRCTATPPSVSRPDVAPGAGAAGHSGLCGRRDPPRLHIVDITNPLARDVSRRRQF